MTIDPNGRETVVAPNGQLTLQCSYRNGRLSGAYRECDSTGKLLRQGYYHNGQMNGTWKIALDSSWETEATYGVGEFVNDRPMGTWCFYLNERPHSIVEYTLFDRTVLRVFAQN